MTAKLLTSNREAAFNNLEFAFDSLLSVPEIRQSIPDSHILKTSARSARAILELVNGCWQDPKEILEQAIFDSKYDELLWVNEIPFVSMCAHHMLPFLGKVYFGYLPNKHIVGLSKIPRFIECIAHRPQIQEEMSQVIVDTFMGVVQPYGCGVVIEAWHTCMMIRGARSNAYSKTSALRGSIKENEKTRTEFLNGLRKTTEQIWP